MDGAAPLARAVHGLLPVEDARGALRVLLASLAPGGAERIVIEWLAAEAAAGREVELAVLHGRRIALGVPPGIALRVRGREAPEAFLGSLAADWKGGAPVSAHLVTDEGLAILWRQGVRVVPVVHNAREGWRNDPAAWPQEGVPLAVACADSVRAQMLAAGCRVPVAVIRHRPAVGAAAVDPAQRRALREELGIAQDAFVVLAVGAHKAQKDHARAVEVLAALARRREAVLVIAGGVLDRAGFRELGRVAETAARLGVAARLRLPGWTDAIEPYLAASDALLNVSRFEGLSIAAQEALAAGLPVVATDVGGQREIAHPELELLPCAAPPRAFVERLVRLPVRTELRAQPLPRAPRAWSLTTAWREPSGHCDALFVTANLNAGGAQRSLVNLGRNLPRRLAFAIAVCGESTHPAFATALREDGVDCFRASTARDDVAIAESLLAHAARRGACVLCFWNVAPGVKLLVAKFAPPALRLVDVSPGAYAFEELESAHAIAGAIGFGPADYYARLDALVLKHAAAEHPPCRRIEVIANGVASRERAQPRAGAPRFLVNGRIAPSKRLETIVEALALLLRRHPAVEVHVVGSAEPRHAGYLAELGARARGLPVRFRGPDFDLACLAESWTAAVVLGTHQGSPNAVLEAMAASIPVIANDSGGTRELVDSGTGWLLCEDVAAAELAGAMARAIEDPAEARRRAAQALERVRRDHTLEGMARRYAALLDALAGREKMAPWNSASVPVVPPRSPSVPSPTMPG